MFTMKEEFRDENERKILAGMFPTGDTTHHKSVEELFLQHPYPLPETFTNQSVDVPFEGEPVLYPDMGTSNVNSYKLVDKSSQAHGQNAFQYQQTPYNPVQVSPNSSASSSTFNSMYIPNFMPIEGSSSHLLSQNRDSQDSHQLHKPEQFTVPNVDTVPHHPSRLQDLSKFPSVASQYTLPGSDPSKWKKRPSVASTMSTSESSPTPSPIGQEKSFGLIRKDNFDESVTYPSKMSNKCPVTSCSWNLSEPRRRRDLRKHIFEEHLRNGKIPPKFDSKTARQLSMLIYKCKEPKCEKHFSRSDSLKRHFREVHLKKSSRFNKWLEEKELTKPFRLTFDLKNKMKKVDDEP